MTKPPLIPRGMLLLGLFVGAALRAKQFTANGEFDLSYSMKTVGQMRLFANVYVFPYYNYSPLWSWVCQLSYRLSTMLHVPFESVIRLILCAFDLLTTRWIYRTLVARGTSQAQATAGCLLYWCNPCLIAVTTAQGMFDNIAIFFLARGVSEDTEETRLSPRAAVFFALSVATKQITLLFLPFLFFRKKHARTRLGLVASFCGLFLLLLFPYLLVAPREILRNVLFYSGPGNYALLPTIDAVRRHFLGGDALPAGISMLTALTSLFLGNYLALRRAPKDDPFIGMAVIAITVASLSWGSAVQYLVWALPFLSVSLFRYPLACSLALSASFVSLVVSFAYRLLPKAPLSISSVRIFLPASQLLLLAGLLVFLRTRRPREHPA